MDFLPQWRRVAEQSECSTVSKTANDYAQKALALWNSFDADKRAGICFGLVPFGVLQEAKREGYDVGVLAKALAQCAEEAVLRTIPRAS